MSKGNLIIGAGGHAKVIADAMLMAGISLIGFVDDDVNKLGKQVLGFPILGKIDQWREFDVDGLVIGVGDNHIRRGLHQKLDSTSRPNWITIIHPRATVAGSVKLGFGTVVLAGAIVNPDTIIGHHTIINTGSTVDHDCVIGDYVHVAPGVHLAGDVQISDNTFIGIGTTVIPGCHIGENTMIGAGAVVIRDIPAGAIAKGVPAHWDN